MAAGRWWAGAGRTEDTREADAEALGFETEMPIEQEKVEVWAEHWPALEVFVACRTQWRVAAGASGINYLGLDYPALESVMRMRGIENPAEILDYIQYLEAGALEVINQ